MKTWPIALFVVLLAVCARAEGRILLVHPTIPLAHSSIGEALRYAGEGDTILVRKLNEAEDVDIYGIHLNLFVLADSDKITSISWRLYDKDQTAVIRGLRMRNDANRLAPGIDLRGPGNFIVEDCQLYGRIFVSDVHSAVLRDVHVQANKNPIDGFPVAALEVFNSGLVSVQDCTFHGRSGRTLPWGASTPPPAPSGGTGIVSSQSRLEIQRTLSIGGTAGKYLQKIGHHTYEHLGFGGVAIELDATRLRLHGVAKEDEVIGGYGELGGPALRLMNESHAEWSGLTLKTGGAKSGRPSPRFDILDDSQVVELDRLAPWVQAGAMTMSRSTLLTLGGEADTVTVLLMAGRLAPIEDTPFGPVHVDLQHVWLALPALLSPSGRAHMTLPVPNAPELVGLPLYFQSFDYHKGDFRSGGMTGGAIGL